jgi:ribonuclease-3
MYEAPPSLLAALGHVFHDPRHLELALTHRSAAFESAPAQRGHPVHDNERMEFLGDVVLAFVVSDALWRRCPSAPEGVLTRMRAAVVNETVLADIAARLGVGDALLLGRGEDRSGGRAKPSLLANTLEAIFAAVYLDAGLEGARAVVLRLLAPAIEHVTSTEGVTHDEKTRLQEFVQARHNLTPRYELTGAEGPDHQRVWHVEVHVGDLYRARGSGRSKKAAERDAARAMLVTFDTPSATEASARET